MRNKLLKTALVQLSQQDTIREDDKIEFLATDKANVLRGGTATDEFESVAGDCGAAGWTGSCSGTWSGSCLGNWQ